MMIALERGVGSRKERAASANQPPSGAGVAVGQVHRTGTERRTILVVEDDPRVRAMAVEMFEILGATVLDAYNAVDALRLLSGHPEIALLFTDVRMPGMTGIELAAEARRRRPDLIVVLTSGYLDGAPLDGTPFLRKPYRLSDLAAIVRGGAAPI